MTARVAIGPLLAALLAVPVLAADRPREALQLSLKQDVTKGKARAAWVSNRPPLELPAEDPTIAGGTLVVTGADERASVPLPAAGWKVNRKGTRYRFVNRLAPRGPSPVKLALVKQGKMLKVVVKDSLIQLDDTTQGAVSVVLEIGSDRYCSTCTAPRKDEPGKFVAKKCVAPLDCEIAPPRPPPCAFLRAWGGACALDTGEGCVDPDGSGPLELGDGQFTSPTGVATDASGKVYVADSNGRIQAFDADGAFLGKWGSPGSGDGQFMGPRGLAIGASGDVYVGDEGNHRIQRFTASGVFVSAWGSLGGDDGQFASPTGVATDASGNVYVADGNNRIQKFDASGAFLGKWGSPGGDDGQFSLAPGFRGLATDTGGNVYVADGDNDRIQKFDASGTFLGKWGGAGRGDGQFNRPRGLATDASGNVYVADGDNNRIHKFDGSGSSVGKWGRLGSGDGQFSAPGGLATDASGNLYVADAGNHRIQKFTCVPAGSLAAARESTR